MRPRVLLAAALTAATVALTTATTAGATTGTDSTGSSGTPRSIPLPTDFAPEGIAVGCHGTFYTGSLWDGDIYRGSLRSGEGRVFVDLSGSQATGMKVDRENHLLVVSGGSTGEARFYDTRTGKQVARLQLAPRGGSFINDVALGHDAAYFTNSAAPQIFEVPVSDEGAVGDASTITVSGPAAPIVGGIGLNGIDVARDGTLLVANSGLLGIFTVDPATGQSHQVRLPTGPLPNGPDGILLDREGDTHILWVVANFSNTILKLRLGHHYARGRIEATLTNADVGGLLRVPTTIARYRDELAVVNARFDLGAPPPFGTGAPPGTAYDVVVLPRF